MGRKLDALLGRKFKTSKFKATVNLAISRLSVLKNQRQARLTVARSDIIQLLNLNHHDHALLRVDQVIKEQNMLDVFVMVDGYCHLLLQRVNLIEQEKECPDELKEAASSLLYAAPRCGEFPEIQEIRAILTSRYGKEFAYGAIELRSNCGVNTRMIQKLSPRQSSLQSRMKILQEIATENGIVLHLEDASPVITEGGLVVEQNRNQPMTEPEMEGGSINSKLENNSTVLPDELIEVLSFSESRKGKKYRDVEDAAQAAFESAAYAAAAARAAVELSRSRSFGSDKPTSRPKVPDPNSEKSKLHTRHEKSCESESENEEKKMVFYESDNEIDVKQGAYDNAILDSGRDYHMPEGSYDQKRFEISPKNGELGPEPEIDLSEIQEGVQQLDLTKGPFSVRTRRVYVR